MRGGGLRHLDQLRCGLRRRRVSRWSDRPGRRDLHGGAHVAIGKDTTAAIQSGFAYGFAGLVDGIDRRLAGELGEPATFIATGGLAPTIAPHCETIDEVDSLLTLTGLRLIYERNAS